MSPERIETVVIEDFARLGREPIEVALGLVVRSGRILVRRRRDDPELGEVWEFPGGKIAPDETPESAVAREVEEETGLIVRVGELVSAHSHIYPDRRVVLYAYLCAPLAAAESPPSHADPTDQRWVTPEGCRALEMPPANWPIIEALGGCAGIVRERIVTP